MRKLMTSKRAASLLFMCASFALAQYAVSHLMAQDADTDWTVFLPAGNGQMQVSAYCTTCHGVKLVISDRRADEAGWTAVVEDMVSQGAPAPEEDVPVMASYLARYFGDSTPKLELPVAVNSDPKEILRLLPGLGDAEVTKVLEARQKESLKDLTGLEAVIGKEKAKGIKSFISFSARN